MSHGAVNGCGAASASGPFAAQWVASRNPHLTQERDMKVFVWAEVGQCSYSYHSGGGVVVFAETEQRAREIANATPGCAIQESETPEEVRDVAGGGERVFIMPNAGCC